MVSIAVTSRRYKKGYISLYLAALDFSKWSKARRKGYAISADGRITPRLITPSSGEAGPLRGVWLSYAGKDRTRNEHTESSGNWRWPCCTSPSLCSTHVDCRNNRRSGVRCPFRVLECKRHHPGPICWSITGGVST